MSMAGQKWLLDTNVLLAARIKPEVLPTDMQTLLQNPASTVYLSAASLWKIAIKHSLGRDDFDFLPEDIHQLALQTGFTELPIASSDNYAIAHMADITATRSTVCWSRKRSPSRLIC